MNKIMIAVAVAIAMPGVAHAQAAPADKPKMDCCKAMKDECACCEKMAGKPAEGASTPSPDPHAGHDMGKGGPAADGHTHH